MSVGDFLTHWSARLAAIFYVVSILQQLRARRIAGNLSGRSTWTLGMVLLWLHVALALHFTYHWDHALMVRQTARQTQDLVGFYWRGSAYVNYTFMLLWAADATWWWIAGDKQHRRRPVWVSMIIHGFLAFIAFNAVVVFAQGPVRWCGAGACVVIAAVAWQTRRRAGLTSASVVQEQQR